MDVPATSSGLSLLLISAVRAIIIAGFAGLGIGIFRLKATAARLVLWRCVLLAALAMPLLGTLLPPTSIPIPTFLETPHSESTDKFRIAPKSTGTVMSSSPVEARASASHLSFLSIVESPSSTQPQSRDVSRWSPVHFETVAAAIYSLVAVLFLLRFLPGVNFSRRLVQASRLITEERLRTCLASSASKLRAIPQVFESTSVSVPVTTGILRPAILLPGGWGEWDDATLGVVLAHESSHIVRRDSLTQFISLFHRAIFWFSPLAWWLDRRLASLAEEASDEAVLAQGADRSSYARTLLGFLEAQRLLRRRVWWQGVSMGNGGHAEQRLEKILAWRGSIPMNLKKSAVAAIIVFMAPVLYLIASVRPLSPSQQTLLFAAPAGQTEDQPARLSIVVDKSCLIQPESDPLVLGDHSDAFRDDAICHLESVLSSHHIEEKLTEGERSRFFVRVAEQEYVVQNPTDEPVVFIIRHDVPENWIVDSNTPPSSMDGSTAVYRINAEPGQKVGLHVGIHRSYPIKVEPWDVVRRADIPPEGTRDQPARLSIVVDKSCLIQPESDPSVLGDHDDAFRDDAICKLESVFTPHHIEEKLTEGERSRVLVRGAEQEYVVQNPTDKPAVFIIRHDVPENWIVDSNTPPSSMDGSTAVYRINAEPGQRARLHVGIHRSYPIDPN